MDRLGDKASRALASDDTMVYVNGLSCFVLPMKQDLLIYTLGSVQMLTEASSLKIHADHSLSEACFRPSINPPVK